VRNARRISAECQPTSDGRSLSFLVLSRAVRAGRQARVRLHAAVFRTCPGHRPYGGLGMADLHVSRAETGLDVTRALRRQNRVVEDLREGEPLCTEYGT
jgi:hypothetical protein